MATGIRVKRAKTTNAASTFIESISETELIVPICLPANAKIIVPGMMPSAVVQMNVLIGIFVSPDKKLIRKKGNTGIRRIENR